LTGSVDAPGELTIPATASQWFCVGGDAAGTNAGERWNGEVVLARIYDTPLSAPEAVALWNEVKDMQDYSYITLGGIMYLKNATVKKGGTYNIVGRGFEKGDKVELQSGTNTFTCATTIADGRIKIAIPTNFVSGEYSMTLLRGEESEEIGTANLTASDTAVAPEFPGVIAHRGFHTTSPASPNNSIESLTSAMKQGFYASEADFYVTADDVVVSFHDTKVNGIDISTNNYAVIKDIPLANGELLPLFEDYIEVLKTDPSTKLIVEIKDHFSVARNNKCADLIAAAVKAAGLEEQVEYITFNYALCKYLSVHPDIPTGTTVGYLNSDRNPTVVDADGINCIDYTMGSLRSNKTWIADAHALDMAVNVWTVNNETEMMEFVNAGVDFITTDYPQTLEALYVKLTE
jgi:glycerophosphoryl diester phosphodiesterase